MFLLLPLCFCVAVAVTFKYNGVPDYVMQVALADRVKTNRFIHFKALNKAIMQSNFINKHSFLLPSHFGHFHLEEFHSQISIEFM